METISNFLAKARDYAVTEHNKTNHTYNGFSYHLHLSMVVEEAQKYIHLIPEGERDNILAACWCHDLIEDCRQTYNDVKMATNERVAELVYALTNEKGKNRKERGNEKYYKGIRECSGATFVKVCDRLANFKYSLGSGSKMVEMYRKENQMFVDRLYVENYDLMLTELTLL